MSSSTLTMIGLYNYDNTIFDGLTFPAGIDKQIAVDEILTRCGEFEILYPNLAFLKSMITHWGDKHYRTFDKWISALNIDFEPLYNYDRYEEYTDSHQGSGRNNERSNDIEKGENRTDRNGSENMASASSTEGSENSLHNTAGKESENTDGISESSKNMSGNGLSMSGTNTDSSNDQTVNRNVSAYDAATMQPKEEEITHGTGNTSGNGISNTINSENTTESDVNVTNRSSDRSEQNLENRTDSRTDQNITSRSDSQNEQNTNNLSRQNERSSEHSTDDITKHNAHLYGNIGVTTSTQMLEDYIRVERFNIYEQIADIFVDEFCVRIY